MERGRHERQRRKKQKPKNTTRKDEEQPAQKSQKRCAANQKPDKTKPKTDLKNEIEKQKAMMQMDECSKGQTLRHIFCSHNHIPSNLYLLKHYL